MLKARARPRPLARAATCARTRAVIRQIHIQIQIQIQIQGDTNTSKHSASTLDTGPWCDLCGQPRCATTASAAPPPSHCASSPSTEGQHWIFLSLQHRISAFLRRPSQFGLCHSYCSLSCNHPDLLSCAAGEEVDAVLPTGQDEYAPSPTTSSCVQ